MNRHCEADGFPPKQSPRLFADCFALSGLAMTASHDAWPIQCDQLIWVRSRNSLDPIGLSLRIIKIGIMGNGSYPGVRLAALA